MELAAIFTDNMVLQRDKSVRIWGTGEGGGVLSFLGQDIAFTAKNNYWCVELPAHPAGGPYEMTLSSDNETITLCNILIGEVWLAGGQSNMQFTLSEAENGFADAVGNMQIRYYLVPRILDPDNKITESAWQECTTEVCLQFSAIGYYFACYLQKALGVPVGIISCNQGASRVESWTDKALLNGTELALPDDMTHIDARIYPFNYIGCLYDNMLLKVAPYGMKGVIWYQGESNRGCRETGYYCRLFGIMADNWRNLWKDNTLPFLTVQLSPFCETSEGDDNWAVLREQQMMAAKKIPYTAMVTIGDIGDACNIHPPKKKAIGERLSYAARNIVYSEDIEYSGPIFKGLAVEGQQAVISFDHVENGMFADGKITDLYICGEDEIYYCAESRIDGKSLIVWSDCVTKPAAVKLGFCNAP